MAKFVVLFLVSLALSYSLGEESSIERKPGRKPRNYDNIFSDYESYHNVDDTEKSDKPVYSDTVSKNVKPQRENKPHTTYETLKGIDQSFPSYPAVFKGYPYWKDYPQFKSKIVFPDSSPDQIKQMMTMMNSMKMLQDTNESNQPGLFSKLISDPKAILVAAILPVSIMLASFIPLLVNYFMTGVSLPTVISSTANNKIGRSFNDTGYLDTVLEGLAKYGERLLESDGCIEQTICNIAIESSDGRDGDYLQRAASAVANIVRSEWLGQSRAAFILSAINHRNCSNLCVRNKRMDEKLNLM